MSRPDCSGCGPRQPPSAVTRLHFCARCAEGIRRDVNAFRLAAGRWPNPEPTQAAPPDGGR